MHEKRLHSLDEPAAFLKRVAGSIRGVDDDGVLSWEGHLGAMGLPGPPSRPRYNVRASCVGPKTEGHED